MIKGLSKFQVSVGVMIILHTVGTVGMLSTYQHWFVPLTPLNLIVSGYFVLRHAKGNNRYLFAMVGLLAFLVEMLGVQTGFPFGDYRYGSALGPQIFEVPLLIGLLWLLLLIGSIHFVSRWIKNMWVIAILTGAIMTGLDFLIEPVAIKLNFWNWYGESIPWNNYLGWFVTAFLLALLGQRNKSFGNNKAAEVFLWIQFGFFLSLNLFL